MASPDGWGGAWPGRGGVGAGPDEGRGLTQAGWWGGV